jgi:uncharacterized PurR-regulated membrane protein YhhQ (DUF165 family)
MVGVMVSVRVCVVVAFLGTVVAANWALATFGIVPIGFGLSAPAGVFAAGVAFTLRDWLHEVGNRRWVMAAIVGGAGLSYAIEPTFAIASGVAFALSELLDLMVYTPLRTRGWVVAVAASNAVGLVVDSMVFLWLAFGSLAYLDGQVVGKVYMTGVALVVVGIYRRRRDLFVR